MCKSKHSFILQRAENSCWQTVNICIIQCLRPFPFRCLSKNLWNSVISSAVTHHFLVGDKGLALLPVPGSVLAARFSGPYEIRDQLSETDEVISTPERRRKSIVCHVNMLKPATEADTLHLYAAQPRGSSALIGTDTFKSVLGEDGLTLQSNYSQESSFINLWDVDVSPLVETSNRNPGMWSITSN